MYAVNVNKDFILLKDTVIHVEITVSIAHHFMIAQVVILVIQYKVIVV